jgi:TonB family protein
VALSGGARLLVTYHGGQNLAILDLVDPALGLTAGSTGPAILRFGALPEQRADALAQTVTATNGANLLILRLAPSRYAGRLRQLAEAASITITFGNHPPVTHEVPGAREGVPALLACAEEARNALPEAERLQRASLGSYFSSADYPSSSVENREQGTVRFWIEVSAQGRVTDCHIVQSSGSAALDTATCRVMRERARYTPARDANGRPVASYDGDYSLT